MMALETAGLRDDPAAFFAQFESIVLVANSADVASLIHQDAFGPKPLFVFFNKVFRILDEPFQRDCILISRSSTVGSSLIYRGELGAVMKLLDTPHFHGIINFRAGPQELLSLPEDFKRTDVATLDLTDAMGRIYPSGKLPSTGFAMIAWLASLNLGLPIYPVGFTGVREDTWRVYDVHDWTWEQIVLSILYSKGVLRRAFDDNAPGRWPVEAITREFPQIEPGDVDKAAVEVLSTRLSATNRSVDEIFRAIKLQLGLGKLFRAIRPKSRKARARETLKARIDGSASGNGTAQ